MAHGDDSEAVFREFVVKIASRCDLACDHCYVYEHADQSWRGRPRFLALDVAEAATTRIAEHCRAHGLAAVTVVLHGGEPLLAGVAAIRTLVRRLRSALPTGCEADIRIQTNGLLLDENFCRLFFEERISVGVSIDGDRAANDRHRRYLDGRSSYGQLVEAIGLLAAPPYRAVFGGLLCTIDPRNDPIAVYDALAAFDPPRIDFLLPHATWADPPERDGSASYARWLLAIHRRWSEQGRPMDVRTFTSIADLLAGRGGRTESLGLEPADIAVIETDGGIEQADSLKTAYDGAAHTGFNVLTHSLDEAAAHPGFAARRLGAASLSGPCRRCPVVEVCGAGLYAHRWNGKSFENPSVYCEDLYELITNIPHRPERAPTVHHAMTAADFRGLAGGVGTPAAAARIREAEASSRLHAFRRTARQGRHQFAWRFVTGIHRLDPTVLPRVLAYPYLDLDGADALEKIALSCAVLTRTNAVFELRTAHQGTVTLPAVGTLAVGTTPTRVAVDAAGRLAVDGRPAAPTRNLALAGPLELLLECRDPARDRFHHTVASPLSDSVLRTWRAELRAATELLAAHHPEALAVMSEVLTTVTPLAASPGVLRSGTARHSFGAIGVALPTAGDDEPGEALACLLLHEVQHLKLNAILDMFDLHDGTDTALYRVGWRPDARPLEPVLHGVYAHLAVVDYWRRRADGRNRTRRDLARDRAARWAGHVSAAIAAISGSPALTGLGLAWLEAARDTSAQWSPTSQHSDTLVEERPMPRGEGGASGSRVGS